MRAIRDADKQFSTDYALLAEGRYREWFYKGLDESSKRYVKLPARELAPPEPDNYLIDWQNTQVKGWQQKAACKDVDPVIFLPYGREPKAKYSKPDAEWRKYCPSCPVRETCLQAARESASVGIWGGVLRLMDYGTSTKINEYDDETVPKRGRPRKKEYPKACHAGKHVLMTADDLNEDRRCKQCSGDYSVRS